MVVDIFYTRLTELSQLEILNIVNIVLYIMCCRGSPRQMRLAKQTTYIIVIRTIQVIVICGADGTWIATFARLDPPQLEWEVYNNKRNERTYPNP